MNHGDDKKSSNQGGEDKNPSPNSAKGRGGDGGGGATRSWGTTVSGQSMSTSGSVGSPSSRNEVAMATPASDRTLSRLNNTDSQGDEAGSQGPAGKKKRGQRAVGGDKSGRGLRQFSMKGFFCPSTPVLMLLCSVCVLLVMNF